MTVKMLSGVTLGTTLTRDLCSRTVHGHLHLAELAVDGHVVRTHDEGAAWGVGARGRLLDGGPGRAPGGGLVHELEVTLRTARAGEAVFRVGPERLMAILTARDAGGDVVGDVIAVGSVVTRVWLLPVPGVKYQREGRAGPLPPK